MTHGIALVLGNETCAYCAGKGMRNVYKAIQRPCSCVYRAIFRACLSRFRDCADNGTAFSTVTWEFYYGNRLGRIYSRKQEEYMADFCLVSRRVLDDEDYKLFRFYFLLGADWSLCARQLKLERGNFFHSVYRIERTLGKTFLELQPYPLYPLDEYFGSTVPKGPAMSAPLPVRQGLRPPMAFHVTAMVQEAA